MKQELYILYVRPQHTNHMSQYLRNKATFAIYCPNTNQKIITCYSFISYLQIALINDENRSTLKPIYFFFSKHITRTLKFCELEIRRKKVNTIYTTEKL